MKSAVDDVMDESFFRTCWLIMKAGKPRLRSLMDKIELDVAGVKTEPKPKLKKQETDKKNERPAPVRV